MGCLKIDPSNSDPLQRQNRECLSREGTHSQAGEDEFGPGGRRVWRGVWALFPDRRARWGCPQEGQPGGP